MKGNSLHDLKWRNSWNLFMNDFYSWWVPWHHISNLSWRAPSRLTVQAAWITGACLVCLGHGFPGMIAHDPWYTTPPPTMNGYMKKLMKLQLLQPTNMFGFPWYTWYSRVQKVFLYFCNVALGDVTGWITCHENPSEVTGYGDSQQGWRPVAGSSETAHDEHVIKKHQISKENMWQRSSSSHIFWVWT